jgi:hypothetical protein
MGSEEVSQTVAASLELVQRSSHCRSIATVDDAATADDAAAAHARLACPSAVMVRVLYVVRVRGQALVLEHVME